jgi:hypothetical protein
MFNGMMGGLTDGRWHSRRKNEGKMKWKWDWENEGGHGNGNWQGK